MIRPIWRRSHDVWLPPYPTGSSRNIEARVGDPPTASDCALPGAALEPSSATRCSAPSLVACTSCAATPHHSVHVSAADCGAQRKRERGACTTGTTQRKHADYETSRFSMRHPARGLGKSTAACPSDLTARTGRRPAGEAEERMT
eukprot:9126069-Pyramimonas_sp.AAC.1